MRIYLAFPDKFVNLPELPQLFRWLPGGIGRHKGLKIPRASPPVPVRFRREPPFNQR